MSHNGSKIKKGNFLSIYDSKLRNWPFTDSQLRSEPTTIALFDFGSDLDFGSDFDLAIFADGFRFSFDESFDDSDFEWSLSKVEKKEKVLLLPISPF